MIETAAAVAQIDDVLAAYQEARSRAKYDDLSDLEFELAALVVRLQAAVDRLTMPGSTYFLGAQARLGSPDHVRLPALVGVLHALRSDLQAGYLTTVAELLHAGTFDDFLDMATELVDKGYKDSSAVLAGSVLESHIRLMCTKHGVSTLNASGRPQKADVMNGDLVKAGVYNLLEQKQVTADLGVRNSSAHGQYADYDEGQVRRLIANVRQFLVRHPA